MQETKPKRSRIWVIAHLLFWGFNVPLAFTIANWFVLFAYSLRMQDWLNFRQVTSLMPIDIVCTFAIVCLMPFCSLIAAVLTRSYRNPRALLQILYGIELPILAFTLARLVFLKTLTPFNIIILLTAAVSIFSYILYTFLRRPKSSVVLAIRTVVFESAVIVGAYASLLMLFFLPIVIAFVLDAVKGIFTSDVIDTFSHYRSLWAIVFSITAFIAASSMFLSLIATPFIGLFLYYRAWRRSSQELTLASTRTKSKYIKLGWGLAYVLATIVVAYQGSMIWFYSQMQNYQAATTFEQRRQIAEPLLKDGSIQPRLVDTYLAHYRYLTDAEMTILADAYKNEIKVSDPVSKQIQQAFTTIAFPFVYGGKFEEDVKKAGEYYQDLYDEPIQLAQSKNVSRILSTSFDISTDPLKSSVLDRSDEDVYLTAQTVKATPDVTNTFATVTIEEEYENLTSTPQEVYYVFSLPQDSVVTDLKIGADLELASEHFQNTTQATPVPTVIPTTNTPNATPFVLATPIPQKDAGAIAPKGAANAVFESQYQARIDPAILEQVGPTQYKLRVYPIPVSEKMLQAWQRNQLASPVRNQKMRFSYITPIETNGAAALPIITEHRNIFSDHKTVLRTGENADKSLGVEAKSVPVLSENDPCRGDIQTLSTTNGMTLYIPHTKNPWFSANKDSTFCQQPLAGSETQIHEKHLAIMVDSSYSMGKVSWKETLEKELSLSSLLQSNNIDLYYFNDFISTPISLNQEKDNPKIWNQFSFGKTNRLKALEAVAGKYDAVFMFTDASEADAVAPTDTVKASTSPLYLIHLSGKYPKYPDSLTYYLQASGAQEDTSGKVALQRYAAYLRAQAAVTRVTTIAPLIVIGNTGTWISFPASTPPQVLTDVLPQASVNMSSPQIVKLANRYEIQAQMRFSANQLANLQFLDHLQNQAVSDGIVTPFSSLLVVTTDQQREQLRLAATQANRFSVGYDLGEQRLVEPTSGGLLGTSAVPEPGEWALLLTALVSLTFVNRVRIFAYLRSRHHE